MANTCTWMEQLIKAFGLQICSMVKVSRHGLMALYMKECIKMVKRKERVTLNGEINLNTKGIFKTIILKGMGNTFGMMVEGLKESGWIIRCMVEGCSNGQTVEYMKVSITKIRSMDLESFLGLMEESTQESG